mmetsp:Transcript_98483/g.195340  ORF Transcript_98483/g.195340 Transcript_98483/m.195340 type:complete len:241 (-) Transcript_98483:100-822(-)
MFFLCSGSKRPEQGAEPGEITLQDANKEEETIPQGDGHEANVQPPVDDRGEVGETEWLGMLATANRLVDDLEEPAAPLAVRARIRDPSHEDFHEDDWDEEAAKDEAFDALRDGKPLYSLPERLRSDKEIVLAAIASEGSFCYNYIGSRELRERDRDVVLALVAADGSLLQMASEELRGDRQVVLTALRTCADALRFASKPLQADKALKQLAAENHKQEQRIMKEIALKACGPGVARCLPR